MNAVRQRRIAVRILRLVDAFEEFRSRQMMFASLSRHSHLPKMPSRVGGRRTLDHRAGSPDGARHDGLAEWMVMVVRFNHPIDFLTGQRREKAVEHLRMYFRNYTGSWFSRLSDSDPNRITACDFTAVTTLGVSIPTSTVIWLLNDGAQEATRLLTAVPQTRCIWDPSADLSSAGDMWKLWSHVRSGGWPNHVGGMGRTKTSKLLAAKRPHLVPVHDSRVQAGLFGAAPANYWDPWQRWFAGAPGVALRDLALDVRQEAGVGADISVLRIVDIVIWMAQKLG